MNNESDKPESSSGNFLKTVQPLRDLESNWTVDLAKNLEEYLLKICSGQISVYDDSIFNVNFAEAALLLQGSVQVYSRKVEYLYSLVLHALDFISQKSQDEQAEGETSQKGATGAYTAKNDEDDQFWVSDDISVEPKISLDSSTCKEPPSHFVRPPSNLVVLEGECLDAGDASELESYLLGTSDLYRDFILLDSCDAVVVDSFLDSKGGRAPTNACRGSSIISKGRKSFLSPTRQSVGAGPKLSVRKTQDANLPQSPLVDYAFVSNDGNVGCSTADDFTDGNDDFGIGDQYSEPHSDCDDDNDDPWKPLNPHETGNLKVKPYKKVKANMKLQVGRSRKRVSLTSEFPLAKFCGPIGTDLIEIWELKFGPAERLGKSKSLYDKLRQSLLVGESKIKEAFDSPEDNDDDNGYDSGGPDIGPTPDFDMPDNTFNNDDIPLPEEKHDVPEAPADLEDLCRSHLDALLATLAENEKQTEMTTRVSTWKQRIEQNLDEQDARPTFDIHKYGERVLHKLSTAGDSENNALSFGDVVKGQEKHDVARTFSALLQLVNNGDVHLVRDSQNETPTCHSTTNPFFVKLLKNERKKGMLLQSSRKRAESARQSQKWQG
ncbi:Condensin-2 complex subunit H2 [Castilleja foliolosa]|uniref:Condensin-2 complex subunit H2 n=1 Tax=Castilleja foliolosa TaxID=1961234 RepID=A0ABD3DHZ7_9LAMI